ncbi:MAG: hypothetical protein GX590_11990, partial [Lentisphaerae bacterium]|nr:hypothetical protein [Lentisphaerota bacterium]
MERTAGRTNGLTGWIIGLGLLAAVGARAATNSVAPEAAGRPTTDFPDIVVRATRLSLAPDEQPYAIYRHDRTAIEQGVGRA